MTTIGIVVFDDAEELDFVGPWEVFSAARAMIEKGEAPGAAPMRVLLVAEKGEPIRCAKGMRVLPDMTLAEAPPLDLVLVPGGQGTRREATNQRLLGWLRDVAPGCTYVTSVCTGSLLLHEAGISRGRRIATLRRAAARSRGERRGERPLRGGRQRHLRRGSVGGDRHVAMARGADRRPALRPEGAAVDRI